MQKSQPSAIHFQPCRRGLEIMAEEARASGARVVFAEGEARIELAGRTLSVLHSRTADQVFGLLDHRYVSLLLVDLRCGEDDLPFEQRARQAQALLARLDEVKDVEARFGFHRIVALVSDRDGCAVDALLLELGARGVRHVLRETAAHREPFGGRVIREALRLIGDRRVGRRALCLSGGGTTGIYFELGALKCLSDCLPPESLQRFDMIFGISAGAVVGSTLAAGFSVDEFMAAIAGVSGSRMPPLDFRIGRPSNLNWRDSLERLRRALTLGMRSVSLPFLGSQVASGRKPMWGQLFGDLVGPFFQLAQLERTLAQLFEIAGVYDQFGRLRTELYVGASDQDRREHVLFGDGSFRDVPISRAVRASAAFTPAFPAVEINGRWYEDGAVTQTSNFAEAIDRGATLVLVVDPFLPHVSSELGSAARRSVFYQMDQVVRTMSFTRFEQARAHMIRKHPEVSMYTFLPSNRLRHLLAENPLEDRRYMEIWRAAYLSTHARLERLGHRMKGDFAAHGLDLTFDRANLVAEQLRPKAIPAFEDFYPGRRIDVPKPDLASARPRERLSALASHAA